MSRLETPIKDAIMPSGRYAQEKSPKDAVEDLIKWWDTLGATDGVITDINDLEGYFQRVESLQPAILAEDDTDAAGADSSAGASGADEDVYNYYDPLLPLYRFLAQIAAGSRDRAYKPNRCHILDVSTSTEKEPIFNVTRSLIIARSRDRQQGINILPDGWISVSNLVRRPGFTNANFKAEPFYPNDQKLDQYRQNKTGPLKALIKKYDADKTVNDTLEQVYGKGTSYASLVYMAQALRYTAQWARANLLSWFPGDERVPAAALQTLTDVVIKELYSAANVAIEKARKLLGAAGSSAGGGSAAGGGAQPGGGGDPAAPGGPPAVGGGAQPGAGGSDGGDATKAPAAAFVHIIL